MVPTLLYLPVSSGEHLRNGTVSVCLSVPSMAPIDSSDVQLHCRQQMLIARAQQQAGSVHAVIRRGYRRRLVYGVN